MKRSALIWIAFGICLTVVLAAMGWISLTAVRLEQEQALAERRAVLEESVRLALWRMDSTLLPIIGQESARPYDAYQSFVPLPRALTSTFTQVETPVLLPSPLLSNSSPFVFCYFQYDPDGMLTSPQVPRGEVNRIAQNNNDVTESEVTQASLRLAALGEFASRATLLKNLPMPVSPETDADSDGNGDGRPPDDQRIATDESNNAPNPPAQMRAELQVANINVRGSAVAQQELGANEYRQRVRNYTNVSNGLLLPNWRIQNDRHDVQVAVLQPLWIGENLLLARRVSIDGEETVQGVWLDWQTIRSSLLGEVADLLPDADLVAIHNEPPGAESRLLTMIPARIIPGTLPVEPIDGWSPTRVSLSIAWLSTISAALLGAILLSAVLSLSGRRAAFVSAVTHELRTPLTTFQLYTEMLDEGHIRDEDQRKQYVRTLRVESERLGHLVENVLAYAQLDRSRQPVCLEDIPVTALIRRVADRLKQRAEQSGMTLTIEPDVNLAEHRLRVDPSAVERILVNLVDNACKYASSATNRTIELSCDCNDSKVVLRVRDFGPGMNSQTRKRLFRPFSKSAREAAGTQPGIGLGLALSRTLARKLGGELRIDSSVTDGACFLLTLPTAGDNQNRN